METLKKMSAFYWLFILIIFYSEKSLSQDAFNTSGGDQSGTTLLFNPDHTLNENKTDLNALTEYGVTVNFGLPAYPGVEISIDALWPSTPGVSIKNNYFYLVCDELGYEEKIISDHQQSTASGEELKILNLWLTMPTEVIQGYIYYIKWSVYQQSASDPDGWGYSYSENFQFQPIITQDEYNALVALYNSTDGDNWHHKPGWDIKAGIMAVNKNWFGLQFRTLYETKLVGIDYLSGLSGTLPPEIGNLYNLESLSLEYNQLNGSIPKELENLTNLKYLNLERNEFTGQIPEQLGKLINLEHLYLSENNLSGSIPQELGSLPNLITLDVNRNQLTGQIPAEIGNCSNLETLKLDENQFTGAIPAELGNLYNLKVLYLYDNQFDELPNLSNLTNLKICDITGNRFDFLDLELANFSDLSVVGYGEQTKVGSEIEYSLSEGDSQLLSVNVEGTNNKYQWEIMRNDTFVPIYGATSPHYTISDFTANDKGIYVCKITNNDFPQLTLFTHDFTILNGTPTTLKENSENEGINIYPNPTMGILNVNLPVTTEKSLIHIYDATGCLIDTYTTKGSQLTFNINSNKGVYFIEVITPDRQSQVFKVVKN